MEDSIGYNAAASAFENLGRSLTAWVFRWLLNFKVTSFRSVQEPGILNRAPKTSL